MSGVRLWSYIGEAWIWPMSFRTWNQGSSEKQSSGSTGDTEPASLTSIPPSLGYLSFIWVPTPLTQPCVFENLASLLSLGKGLHMRQLNPITGQGFVVVVQLHRCVRLFATPWTGQDFSSEVKDGLIWTKDTEKDIFWQHLRKTISLAFSFSNLFCLDECREPAYCILSEDLE